ncbi:MAG: hypothetical protein EPN74_09500 [Rhodanobacter sp.]|nr:MAG: hypothetical protein EPN74_09500 [Rhodanobacter sp.]
MRLLPALLMLMLPLAAAGQSVAVDSATSQWLLAQPRSTQTDGNTLQLPLWLDAEGGHSLSLVADQATGAKAMRFNAPLTLSPVDATRVTASGLQFGLTPNLHAHAEVSEHSWVNQPWRVLGSEVGATYATDNYSIDLSLGANSNPDSSVALPRVLPGGAPGVGLMSSFDSSAQVNARGRLALGNRSGIDLGASVGRIHLLPGNLLGINTLDQRVLSFGVDHGPLSGTLVGRTIQPQAGIPGAYNLDQRWSSIDLGVTWRLPWRGELSVGAQNLWSSGTSANTPAGPEPDQSRTPYVQYHQDL